MSDEFDGLDATEKAAAEVALIRSRTLAGVRSHHLVGEAVEPPQRLRLMSVKQSKTQNFALLSSSRCWHAVCLAAPRPEVDHFVMAITRESTMS